MEGGMPRHAREKKLFSFYRIRQVCKSHDQLFLDQSSRKILIEALLSAKEKHNFKLLGLSISPNGYEMILYDNGSDISKVMRSINISFAMKYKCQKDDCCHIFKERYQSQIISPDDVQASLDSLEPCPYLDPSWLDPLDLSSCHQGQCIDCKKEARLKLDRELEKINLSYEELLKKKAVRNEMIKNIRKNSTLSLQEIGDLFGGLSESAVCKILSR
jgi:hypothetical protein